MKQISLQSRHLFLVNGGWSIWSDYSPWSTSCGYAIRTRVRACTNPVPAFGGKNCEGSDAIVENKNLGSCPGKFSFIYK